MRILVVTSCTGEKATQHERAPVLDDFQKGKQHIEQLHQYLKDVFTPAGKLYTGQQHVRLMRAVDQVRASGALELKVQIVSAGYGIVDEADELPPYEVTFTGMRKAPLKEWSNTLGIPLQFRQLVSEPFDLALILLGDNYLAACDLDENVSFGGPTLFLCGGTMAKKLPKMNGTKAVGLSNPHAKQFGCALIGLKGELAGRLLNGLNQKQLDVDTIMQSTDLLKVIDELHV